MLKLLQFGNFRLGCCCLRPFRNRTPTFVPVFNSWSFVSFRYHLPPLIYQYFLSCPSRQVVLSIQPESLSFPVQGCLAVSVPSVGPRWSPCAACVALTPARSFHPGVLPSEQLRLLPRPRSHIPDVGSTNFQGMIEANLKCLERYKSDPKLYPFSQFSNPGPFLL